MLVWNKIQIILNNLDFEIEFKAWMTNKNALIFHLKFGGLLDGILGVGTSSLSTL